jgi:hypothetical protein
LHNSQLADAYVSFLNLGIQTTISLFVQTVQNLSAVKKRVAHEVVLNIGLVQN